LLHVCNTQCGFQAAAFKDDMMLPLSVFNSSVIISDQEKDDPDLGAPNRNCPGGGPGKGNGGGPDKLYPNCAPQGNLLIIQNTNETVTNDSPSGGCMIFEFGRKVNLFNIGLLDVEESASITVRSQARVIVVLFICVALFLINFYSHPLMTVPIPFMSQTTRLDRTTKTFTSPADIGNNGFWQIIQTQPEFSQERDIQRFELCLQGSGAVSFINYIDCNPRIAANSSDVTPSPTSQPISAQETKIPAAVPTASPTILDDQNATSSPATMPAMTPSPVNAPSTLPTTCSNITCDFSSLLTGVDLGDENQSATLLKDCLMVVSAIKTIDNNVVNVFDSSVVGSDQNWADPDLGSPNRACPDGGPGKGNGGMPESPFPNCEAQGKLLIIQNEDISPVFPNDSSHGGCLVFDFVQPVSLLDMGIMDIDDTIAAITVTMMNGQSYSFDSPSDVGDNGLWKVKSTNTLSAFDGVVTVDVCLPGPGAVSFIAFSTCNS
jgi:hypothetical protein